MKIRRGLNILAILLLWGGPLSNVWLAWWQDRQAGVFNPYHVFTVSPKGWILCVLGVILLIFSNALLREFDEAPFWQWVRKSEYHWPEADDLEPALSKSLRKFIQRFCSHR